MPLHVHRAQRTDRLATGLGALLAEPPTDPFAEELVLVPAPGVERWLGQRLSHVLGITGPGSGDGVCAGVTFRTPVSLLAEIVGIDGNDPWSPEAMVWPLLESIDAGCAEPWCATLATHLGHAETDETEAELRRGRRYAVERRLAGLFASYARQRPRLLADWFDGHDTDGAGGLLDADLSWQPRLFQALVESVGSDPPQIRHDKTIARLREAPAEGLPARVSLFGHTRLPLTDVELLDALSTHHDLHLWLPHPSDTLWRKLSGTHRVAPRADDDSRHTVAHPLLATLGRDLRELQRALPTTPDTDEYLTGTTTSETLLGWLQYDLAADSPRPDGREFNTDDRSVQVHSCHGPARQVDVLREVLLGLLDDDPTLQPRDILVMCPEIESYAPLFTAGFGLGDLPGDAHPAHSLRVRLADRSPTQINPLLGVATELLDLADSRTTASQVLNFAQAAPVRARFSFTDEDVEVITAWVRDANIRWGFDAEHRTPYGLGALAHNTWRFGLDRILTGVAITEDSDEWPAATLPLDDIGRNRVELAGRLAEFLTRLQTTTDALTGARPLHEWIGALRDGVTSLTRADEPGQAAQLHRVLAQAVQRAGSRAETVPRLSDVRALLQGRLAAHPTRANFCTGALTVCTMTPMRSVPHRVVCLAGLDDGVFPRTDPVDGDDVLARRPLTGERDMRSADRQLLLDAVCAAGETLVITYTGADEHTGQSRPPAVPLAELLDALDATTTRPVRDDIVVTHPLQPFATRNVTPGALIPGRPFTFDPTALRTAQAFTGDRTPQRPFFEGPLAAPPPDDIALADLVAFLSDPVKGFFTALGCTLPSGADAIADDVTVEPNALQEWKVGQRLLEGLLRGADPEILTDAELRRGELPPGELGRRSLDRIDDIANQLCRATSQHRRGEPDRYDVDIDLGDRRRLTGTVASVFGDRIVSVGYSKPEHKHLLRAWVPLLALAAHRPDRAWSALCLGRGDTDEQIGQREFNAPSGAAGKLRDLVELYDAGRRQPLPLPPKTSFAWAEKSYAGKKPRWSANQRWDPYGYLGENATPESTTLWGRQSSIDVLLTQPRPGEEVDGQRTRLGALAARLWWPMLRAERGSP